MNLFSLSKTSPACLEKEDFFILPFLSSSSFLSAVVIIVTVIGTIIIVVSSAACHAVENDTIDTAKAEDRTSIAEEAYQAIAIRSIDGEELIVVTVARRSTGAATGVAIDDDDDTILLGSTTVVCHDVRGERVVFGEIRSLPLSLIMNL